MIISKLINNNGANLVKQYTLISEQVKLLLHKYLPQILRSILAKIDQQTADFFDKHSRQYKPNQANQQSVFDFISTAAQGQTGLNNFFERFKEPVLLPSNVENGLGYFGS